ncbi:MAG: TonB-dependent receptor plug domain-containing protein, partial [Opitutales bacterium]|nr:TonB-dependent receptor plug domain-containing protein [Opitutales bacterium]
MSTPLSDVPMGINVITSDFLEDSHIGEFTHAMDYNASITQTGRNDNGNSVASTFAIRGYRNSTMLTDGVLGGMVLPMQMIDRIEVVKVPNTLYGQAEPSGLINVITTKPRAEQGGTIRGITGSNEWYQVKLDYTVRAADDKLGLRIMTDNKETNGWRWLGNREYQFKGLSGSYELAETTDFDFLVAENHATGFPTQRATWSFERIPTDLNGDGDLDDTVGGVKESTARFNNTFLPPEYVSATADNTLDQQYYWMSMGIRHSFSENHNFQYKYNFNERDHLMSAREFNTFNPDGSNPVNNYSNEFISRDEVHTLADIIEFGTGDVKHQLLLGIRESESINNMGRGNYRLRGRNGTENAALRAIEARTGKRFRDVLYKSDITRGTPIWEDDAATVEEIFQYGQRSNQAGRSFQEITTIYATDNIYFTDGQSNVIVGGRNINLDQRNEALGGATTSTLSGSDTNFQFGGVHRINPNLSVIASWAYSFRNKNRTDPNTGELLVPQTSEPK